VHEQLWDVFKADLEELAKKAVPATPIWWQDRVLKFQFGDVITLDEFQPVYVEVDEEKRIVTQCSVTQEANRVVKIKVAKGTLPGLSPVSSVELAALKDYVLKIKPAGTNIQVVSMEADRVKIEADVYYGGQYVESTVKAAVIEAIDEYLTSIPFDGRMNLNKLVDAAQAVEGVEDFVLNNVESRAALISAGSASVNKLVENYDWNSRNYTTVSGYLISEDESGSTLDDTLNMELAG